MAKILVTIQYVRGPKAGEIHETHDAQAKQAIESGHAIAYVESRGAEPRPASKYQG